MKICSRCQRELMDEAKFCFECGAPSQVKKIFCVQCGSKLQENAKFCMNCGAAVFEESKDQAPGVEELSVEVENEASKVEELSVEVENEASKVEELSAEVESEVSNVEEPSVEAENEAIFVVSQPINEEAPTENEIPKSRENRINGILSFAFAVPALVCAVLSINNLAETFFLYFPSMIIFLILSLCFKRKYYKEASEPNKFIKVADILAKIAIPIGLIFTCISVITAIVSFLTSPVFLTFAEELFALIEDALFELGISK